MSCGTCGIQASNTMQEDTGVPAGAPSSQRARCPHCKAFVSQTGAPCRNPRCPGATDRQPDPSSRRHSPHTQTLTPELALIFARSHCPTPERRAVACQDPHFALRYAWEIDNGQPRDDTRAGACQDPEQAYQYALNIDRGPRDDTRAAACQEAKSAFFYACDVDQHSRDDTRAAACQDPEYAYRYARDSDSRLRDDTRAAACQNPQWAYYYAFRVDYAPRDDTRAAACQDPYWAYVYATEVDRAPRDDTRAAACQDPERALRYAVEIDAAPRDDTREAAGQDPRWAGEYAVWENLHACELVDRVGNLSLGPLPDRATLRVFWDHLLQGVAEGLETEGVQPTGLQVQRDGDTTFSFVRTDPTTGQATTLATEWVRGKHYIGQWTELRQVQEYAAGLRAKMDQAARTTAAAPREAEEPAADFSSGIRAAADALCRWPVELPEMSETLDLLNELDGAGLVITDEDLLIDALQGYHPMRLTSSEDLLDLLNELDGAGLVVTDEGPL